ncbi:hypothetical protein CFC21_034711 [Triticum aestivum]|uniref:Uncharacterized protein n=3 Tax=Triticum TaxID=4564 RepID=A0A9R0RFT6_TRITD|nr:hypothetical protein CFC21_034711 [Triticum aestivum]VAH59058.1 unnamed protein product [Triticum turgidum subsp. durum]
MKNGSHQPSPLHKEIYWDISEDFFDSRNPRSTDYSSVDLSSRSSTPTFEELPSNSPDMPLCTPLSLVDDIISHKQEQGYYWPHEGPNLAKTCASCPSGVEEVQGIS